MPKPAPSTAVVPLHWGNGWGEQGSRMVPTDKGVRGLSLGAERPHAPWMGSAAAPQCSSVRGTLGWAAPVCNTLAL